MATLPGCITRFFYTTLPVEEITFNNANFTHLVNLKEIVIQPKSPYDRNYGQILATKQMNAHGLNNLEILRIKVKTIEFPFSDLFLQHLEKLKILDFSRVLRLNLNKLIYCMPVLQNLPVEKLILKNVQSLYSVNYMASINIERMLCPLGHTIQYVDFRFNDITTLTIPNLLYNCVPHLEYVDLRHNLLLHIDKSFSDGFQYTTSLFRVLLNTKFAKIGNQGTKDFSGLYDEDDTTTLEELKNSTIIVISTIILVSIFIGVIDLFFTKVLTLFMK